jgi:hypothetical protein
MIGLPVPIDTVPAVKWLQKLLRQESNGARLAVGLAIAGHVVIAALLIIGAFERTDAAAVDSIPVEIVMEKPDTPAPQGQQAPPNPQASPPPTTPASNEQNPWPSIPAVADVDKHAKAPLATLDVNGIDLPKQPGQDGGDPKRDMAGTPLPSADGEFASGADAASSFAMHVAPVGPAPPQTTAHEPGEDDITAIKEQKTQCGAKARWQSPAAGTRQPARVIGIATEAQALALIRSSQVVTDRRINPKYVGSPQVFAERLDGAGKSSVVLPPGLTVNVGDVIETTSGHVDPSDHCQYIPNIAIGKL